MRIFGIRRAVLAVIALLTVAAFGAGSGEDYVRDVSPSAAARAYFAAVPTNLVQRTVSLRDPQTTDKNGAYFTEDGAISIPPGAMVMFRGSGKCMDPHLPAPCGGEPMQFIGTEKLIPRQLRDTYDTLMRRSAEGDPQVAKHNLQHLVWALRTAGTDDAMVNGLSDAQKNFLDDCSGRHNGFTRYHERMKKRNEKKNGRKNNRESERISVGNFSYDAADLRGSDADRTIERHIEALTEMGEKSTERSSQNLRYGELENGLYTDVICGGGLCYQARVMNATCERLEFNPSKFAAQVGNGVTAGGKRQRVTMTPPSEFQEVPDAAQDGVEVGDQDEGPDVVRPPRRPKQRARKDKKGKEEKKDKPKKRKQPAPQDDGDVEDIPPVPPVPPPKPPFDPDDPTNHVDLVVQDILNIRVVSLSYDIETRTGILTVEVLSGSFKAVKNYLHKNLDNLIHANADKALPIEIPPKIEFEIESIFINDADLCEIKFKEK